MEHLPNITDAARAAALRRMKTLAVILLLAMGAVFVVAFALQDRYPQFEYVRAAAEGGMVGALADWFAVTALFRHPMGLKIPHTAIIPRRKDQIGASLGQFVEENFLSEEVVGRKLSAMNVARRLGVWLGRPEGAERVAREGAVLIRGAMTVLRDDAVQDVIESLLRRHVLQPPWAPTLGRIAEGVLAQGHHTRLVDILVDRAADWVAENRDVITRMVAERSPSWVPSVVDGLVGDKVYRELDGFVRAVQADPDHQVRHSIDAYLKQLVHAMQHDPAMVARVERFKEEAFDDPRVRELVGRTWETVKVGLLEAVEDPASELRLHFTAGVRSLGERLRDDAVLAEKVNRWLGDAAGYVVRTYRSDIAGIITDTVQRWDAEETSRKIELQIGRDLQFIRINGTVVGALAGLVIFTAARALLG